MRTCNGFLGPVLLKYPDELGGLSENGEGVRPAGLAVDADFWAGGHDGKYGREAGASLRVGSWK